MPNHVTTVCTVTGPADAVAEFKAQLFEGAGDQFELFDFDRIIPMPAVLRETESSTTAEYGAHLIIARADDTKSFFADNVAIPSKWVEDMRKKTGAHHMGEVARIYLAAHPEYEREGTKRLRAILETGFASWYPWSIAYWGTKWGAYEVEVRDSEHGFAFKFETAWSFPALTFDCATFDEGWNFAGRGQIGAVVSEPFALCEASDALYEVVYGHAPEKDEE